MDQAAMDFHSLTRRELQALCKQNKIPANMTNVAMADALKSLEMEQGLDEIIDQCLSTEKTVERAAGTASRASTRRKPVKEPQSTQPTTQTRRSTRTGIAESNGGESKDLFGHQTPKVPVTASRSRRVIEPLAQCQMESLDTRTEGKKAIVPETPKVHNVQKSSVRRTGKRQEEASAQQVNSSRRSVRLLGKSLNNLSLNDKKMVQPEVPIIDQKVEDQIERKDIVPGAVGEDLSPLLENEGSEKSDQDSAKSGVSDNVAGLNESIVGCKPSDVPDGSPDHLVNNQQETSEGNFIAEETSSGPNSKQIDLLVSKSSEIEVLKLVALLESVQASARMDSEVEDNRGLSDDNDNDDEDQGRLQSENVKTNLMDSFEKSSNDSDVEGPMQDEEDDAEELGNEALATKDSAVEANRGLSGDGDRDRLLLTGNGMTDLIDSFEKSSIDSDVEGPIEDEKLAEDHVEDHGCDDVMRKDSAEEYGKGSSGPEDQGILQTEIQETIPRESLEKSFDDSSLSNAKRVSMNEEPNGTSDVAITGPENIECGELVRKEPDTYPTSLEDQNEILPNDRDMGAMAAEENTHELMNIMLCITEMKNIEAEESNFTCNQAPLTRGMPKNESPQEQAEKVCYFKTDMHTETEGSSSPRVLAKSDLPQPTQSISIKQSAVQADHDKENFGVSVKKRETQELDNKSMRCLRKLIAEKLAKLKINDRAENTEDEKLGKVAAKVRPALQILPDNRRLQPGEALGS